MKDLKGIKFNMLTPVKISKVIKTGNRKRYYWLCECECGKLTEVRPDALSFNSVKSCGCLKYETSYKNLSSEYQFKSKYKIKDKRLYNCWRNMIKRCSNPCKNNLKYKELGIEVCNEWEDYDTFAEWAINNGYKSNLTIDRIDFNGNYEPSNCRWVTKEFQNTNKSSNIVVEYNNKKITLMELSRITGITYPCLYKRYKQGDRGDRLIRNKRQYANTEVNL